MGFRGRNLQWKAKHMVTLAFLIVFAIIIDPVMYISMAGEEIEAFYERDISIDSSENQEEFLAKLTEEAEI